MAVFHCGSGPILQTGGFKIVTVGSQLRRMSSWFQGFVFLSFIMISRDIQHHEFLVKLVVFPQYPDFYCLLYHLLFQALHISVMVKPTNRMFGTAWAPSKHKASTGLAFLTQMLPNASCLPALYITLWYCVCVSVWPQCMEPIQSA